MFLNFLFITLLTLAASPQKTVVAVSGMVCSFCAQGIEKKFKEKSQVSSVEVDLDNKVVILVFKEGMSLPDNDITQVIEKSGFNVVSIKKEAATK